MPRPATRSFDLSGSEKRRFRRFPLDVPATVAIGDDQAGLQMDIVNFCVAGMLLSGEENSNASAQFVQLEGGEDIHIVCNPAGSSRPVEFSGKVVRISESSLGIEFEQPDTAKLQQLLHTIPDLPTRQLDEARIQLPQHRDIYLQCKQLFLEKADNVINEFLKRIPDVLFKQAGDASSTSHQNACFDALRLYENHKQEIQRDFNLSLYEQLELPQEQEIYRPEQDEELTSDALSLVENDAFDNWLWVNEIITSTERQNSEELYGIEQRLSHIFGQEVGKHNNPLSPYVYATAIYHSLKNFGFADAALKTSYKIFNAAMLVNSIKLYREINQLLVNNGILPKLTRIAHKVPRQEHKPDTPAVSPEQPHQPATLSGEQQTMASAGQQTSPAPTAATGAGTTSAVARGDTAGTDTPGAQQGSARASLYELLNRLRSYNETAAGTAPDRGTVSGQAQTGAATATPGASAPNGAAGTIGGNQPAGSTYSTEDILAALDKVKQDSINIRTKLREQLARVDSAKVVADQHQQAIEVGTDIFDYVIKDFLMSTGEDSWVKRLEVPLLKLGIQDEEVFNNKEHVARQVINRLSLLEMMVREQEESQDTVDTMNTIVRTINDEFDGTPQVFKKALPDIENLFKEQQVIYQSNLEEVLNECEELEQICRKSPQQKNSDDSFRLTSEGEQWLKKVQRLQVGDWIEFTIGNENKRTKLVWHGDCTRRYVFVNAIGRKELAYGNEQLAMMMWRGLAKPMDNPDDPAMDQAQFSMLQKMHDQLVHETTHDHLTGLQNRRELQKKLRKWMLNPDDDKFRYFCYVDINQFKVVNNTCGHDEGDRLIQEISQILIDMVRKTDNLSRLGGDEFAILYESKDEQSVMQVFRKLVNRMKDYRFESGENRYTVVLNIGIVPVLAEYTDPREILRLAEQACTKAKDEGGQRIHLYKENESSLTYGQKMMRWVGLIDRALDENILELLVQSITPAVVDGVSYEHFEVLLRVDETKDFHVSTSDLIQTAELYDRINDVDKWVIKNMFHWLAEHDDELKNLDCVSINLSGLTLDDDHMVDFIREHAEATGVRMETICFEVTETAGVSRLSNASNFINEIKKLGCRFSLDDFGSGLSSYAYLKNMPVDYLKIDGAFVKDILNSPSDHAVVKSICDIGHYLEKEVIAECVENEEARALLRKLGIDYLQGFGISKPVPLDEALQMMAATA